MEEHEHYLRSRYDASSTRMRCFAGIIIMLAVFELCAHDHKSTSADKQYYVKTLVHNHIYSSFSTLQLVFWNKGRETMVLQEHGFIHISQISCSSVASTVHNPAMSVDKKFQPSGHLLRKEPSDVKWIHKFPSAL